MIMSTKTYILTVEEREVLGVSYRLDRVLGYGNCFVITVKDKSDFFCGSIIGERERVIALLCELASSGTPPYAVAEILRDAQLNKV